MTFTRFTPGAVGERLASWGGQFTASIPTGATNTVVKAEPERLSKVLVTVAGTGVGNVQFFDNATTNSGTIIGLIPATVAVGQFFEFQCPANNGIVCQNVLNGPVLTVSFN